MLEPPSTNGLCIVGMLGEVLFKLCEVDLPVNFVWLIFVVLALIYFIYSTYIIILNNKQLFNWRLLMTIRRKRGWS